MNDRKMVLFICTHNSARSQMAEALLNKLGGEKYVAYSGGTEPTAVNPHAIKAMADIGIDITGKQGKHVNTYKGQTFDYVITVCDHAKETCPFFPGAKKYLHQGFQDPSGFIGTEEEKDAAFRRVRDEIKSWIESTFDQEDKRD
ncbi:MAG: arsenate reductase ArsC [candidate division WOR-3 bacterium]